MLNLWPGINCRWNSCSLLSALPLTESKSQALLLLLQKKPKTHTLRKLPIVRKTTPNKTQDFQDIMSHAVRQLRIWWREGQFKQGKTQWTSGHKLKRYMDTEAPRYQQEKILALSEQKMWGRRWQHQELLQTEVNFEIWRVVIWNKYPWYFCQAVQS